MAALTNLSACEEVGKVSEQEERLHDQMSKVSSLAVSAVQSLHLPLLPPCFTHQELLLLIRKQRKVYYCLNFFHIPEMVVQLLLT